MIVALLLLLTLGASAQCETSEGGTAEVKIYRVGKPLLEGQFSVSATRHVRFAKGNLRYQASTGTWDFNEHQYDVLGTGGGNRTKSGRETQSAWIDLFGFATSGWSGSGAIAYQPWDTIKISRYYGPPSGYSAVGDYAYCDWGKSFYAGFRLPTYAEWHYVIYERTNCRNLRGAGTLFGVPGVFLLPDGWNWADLPTSLAAAKAAYDHNGDGVADGFTFVPATGDTGAQKYTANVIVNNTSGQNFWKLLEDAGVVFMPSNGWRDGTTVNYDGGLHYYTSTVEVNGMDIYLMHFREGPGFRDPTLVSQRYYGRSVRLVKDVE